MKNIPVGLALALGCIALAASAACTPAPAPVGPTVGAAATAVATAAKPAASTAVAAVSPVATQVAAAASPVVATAVAAASPAATQAAAAASPVAATAIAASPVRITGAQFNLADTTVIVQNTGGSAIDLAGWRLRVGSATAALPSGARVAPNESVTIHTAAGTNTSRDVYLGQEASSLMSGLRPGASIALVNPQGSAVTEFTLPG